MREKHTKKIKIKKNVLINQISTIKKSDFDVFLWKKSSMDMILSLIILEKSKSRLRKIFFIQFYFELLDQLLDFLRFF
jgi:hypothetical protein